MKLAHTSKPGAFEAPRVLEPQGSCPLYPVGNPALAAGWTVKLYLGLSSCRVDFLPTSPTCSQHHMLFSAFTWCPDTLYEYSNASQTKLNKTFGFQQAALKAQPQTIAAASARVSELNPISIKDWVCITHGLWIQLLRFTAANIIYVITNTGVTSQYVISF